MQKQKKPIVGDIFYLGFKKNYLFGKVLFSIDHQYDKFKRSKKADASNNYLDDAPKNTYLIEMYDGLFENELLPQNRKILIPRVLVTFDGLKDVKWSTTINESVNYKLIEFPEVMTIWSEGKSSYAVLQRGELRFPTTITEDEYETYGLIDTINDISIIPYLCLNMMGKQFLIDESEDYLREETLQNIDLHFNPRLRKNIYEQIKVDPQKPYYELSKENGKDLSRFYV